MLEFLCTPPAQAVISVAILMILMAIGYFAVRRFRGHSDEDHRSTVDWLTNFREMHHEGDISESEFRTIKTVLGEQIDPKLNDAEDTG